MALDMLACGFNPIMKQTNYLLAQLTMTLRCINSTKKQNQLKMIKDLLGASSKYYRFPDNLEEEVNHLSIHAGKEIVGKIKQND